MNDQELLDLMLDLYKFEHQTKDMLNRQVAVFAGSAVLATSAYLAIYSRYDFGEIPWLDIPVVLAFLVAGAALLSLFFAVFRMRMGYAYKYPLTGNQLREYEEELRQFNEQEVDSEDDPVSIEEVRRKTLLNQLMEAQSHNRLQNEMKSAWVNRCWNLLALHAIRIAIFGAPIYMVMGPSSESSNSVHQVEVVNTIEVQHGSEKISK